MSNEARDQLVTNLNILAQNHQRLVGSTTVIRIISAYDREYNENPHCYFAAEIARTIDIASKEPDPYNRLSSLLTVISDRDQDWV